MVTALIAKNTPQRMPGKDRKEQIVKVAAGLFSKKGFSGTTTKEIAEGAGVSEAIIFRHFSTKEALYSAILDLKVKQSTVQTKGRLDEAARRKDDRAFFGFLALNILEFYRKDPTFMKLLLFSALEGHELSEMFFNSTARDFKNQVSRYIRQRMADGAFRKVDARLCARAFVGMVLYHAQVRVLYKTDDIKLSERQLAERFVEMFLSGVSKTSPAPVVRRTPKQTRKRSH